MLKLTQRGGIAMSDVTAELFEQGYGVFISVHEPKFVLYDASDQADIARFDTLDELNRHVKLLIGGDYERA